MGQTRTGRAGTDHATPHRAPAAHQRRRPDVPRRASAPSQRSGQTRLVQRLGASGANFVAMSRGCDTTVECNGQCGTGPVRKSRPKCTNPPVGALNSHAEAGRCPPGGSISESLGTRRANVNLRDRVHPGRRGPAQHDGQPTARYCDDPRVYNEKVYESVPGATTIVWRAECPDGKTYRCSGVDATG
jgi:hypothetical protein